MRSVRTLPYGSSAELPGSNHIGVVGVTEGRSRAEEGEALDAHQGLRPCPDG